MGKLKIAARILASARPPLLPFLDRARLLPEGRTFRVRYCGLRFAARAGVGDFEVLNEVFAHRTYEEGLATVGAGSVVVDIGANIGAFSLAAAQRGAARVYAFEPVASNARIARETAAQNGFGQTIEVVEKAVGSLAGERTLYVNPSDAGGGTFFPEIHSRWRGHDAARATSVPCVSLPGFLDERGIGRVDLLKLDCEGAEFEIIQSIRGCADRFLGVIFEFHSDGKLEATLQCLRESGFLPRAARPPYQVIFAPRR
jgi:FkbM family methyltransferase